MRKVLLLLLVIGLAAVVCTGAAGAAMTITATPEKPTTADTVEFSIMPVDNATKYVWKVDEEEVQDTSSTTFTKKFSEKCTVNVTVEAFNESVSLGSGNLHIEVRSNPPTASFTANITEGSAPLTVQFTGSSSETPDSWSWSFGSDGISEEKDPIHTFRAAGEYSVNLTVTKDEVASDPCTKTITVNLFNPQVNLSANVTSGPAPLSVLFGYNTTLTLRGSVTQKWKFYQNDSNYNESSQVSPVFVFKEKGTYKVDLTVKPDQGDSITETIEIIVGAPTESLVAGFTASPLSGTAPLKVSFKDTSSGSPTSWEWDFSEGSSRRQTVQNPTYTFDDPGTFTVTLTIKDDDGKTNSTTKVITVNAESTATPTKTATRTATPTATAKALTSSVTETPAAEADLVPNPLDIVDEFLRLLLAMLNPANYAI